MEFRQSISYSSFLGKKVGYCFGLSIFLSIVYFLTSQHWLLGKVPYPVFIGAATAAYAVIAVINIIRGKE